MVGKGGPVAVVSKRHKIAPYFSVELAFSFVVWKSNCLPGRLCILVVFDERLMMALNETLF